MTTHNTQPPPGAGSPLEPAKDDDPGRSACLRAWLSLVLYPFTFAGAFVIGEGLYTALDDGVGDPELWKVLVSATPALLVFIIPGLLSVMFGRRAIALGRPDGKWPAIIGAAIGLGFVAINVAAYLGG